MTSPPPGIPKDPFSTDNEDFIDLVFARVESFACKDPNKESSSRNNISSSVQAARDLLGHVLERMNHFLCQTADNDTEVTLPDLVAHALEVLDEVTRSHEILAAGSKDVLDDFFEGIEEKTCERYTDTPTFQAMLKRDLLDEIFEDIENFTCNKFLQSNFDDDETGSWSGSAPPWRAGSSRRTSAPSASMSRRCAARTSTSSAR